jgi:hypothetical protein
MRIHRTSLLEHVDVELPNVERHTYVSLMFFYMSFSHKAHAETSPAAIGSSDDTFIS